MGQTLTRPRESHLMEGRECVDALTGEEYYLWSCPVCGRQEKQQGDITTTLVEGNAPTAEDADRFAEMAKTPEGRRELSGILRQYPGHDKRWVDQAGLMALADELGLEVPLMAEPLVLRFG